MSIESPVLANSGSMGPELSALDSYVRAAQIHALEARQIERCRSHYIGDMYADTAMPAWKEPKVHGKIAEVVETYSAILTENEPIFAPRKRHDEDLDLAEAFFAASDYEWERQRMQDRMAVQARSVQIDGSHFFYLGLESGHDSQLYTRGMSPFSVGLDPDAVSDEEMSFCFIEFTASRAQIEAAFPNLAGRIFDTIGAGGLVDNRDNDDTTFNDGPTAKGIGPRRAQRATVGGEPTEIISPLYGAIGSDPGERFTVREWWFKKGAERELNLILPDGSKRTVKTAGKKGRRIILIEDTYFEELDTDNPHEHGQIPIVRFGATMLHGEAYGYPFILPLLDTAEEIAELDNQARWNIKQMANPVWMVPIQSGVNVKKIISVPGLVIPYRHPFKPEPHVPPPLPGHFFTHRQNKVQEFDTISGLADIDRGQFRGGLDDVSGKAVSLLGKNKYRRMQLIQQSIETGLGRWGHMTMCNAAQYWPRERWLTVLPQKLAMKEEAVPGSVLVWFRPGYQKSADGYVPQVRMEAGSNLPVDKQERANLYLSAWNAIREAEPEEAKILLDGMGIPNTEEWIEAMAVARERKLRLQAPPAGGGGGMGTPPALPGPNKALGGERSPESDLAVMANPNGQEVAA